MQDHNIYEDLQGRGGGGGEREKGGTWFTQHQAVKIHAKLS